MNERNTPHGSHQTDFGIGQQAQSHLHSEPCMLLGGTLNFPQSSTHHILPASGNFGNLELHHLPEHRDAATYYGFLQYTEQHHPPTNPELGVPPSSNLYNLHLNPASISRIFPFPLNHGSIEQLPSSSNYRGNAVPVDDYGSSNDSTDSGRGLRKRKNGNVQFFNMSAGPSSAISPMSNSHFESRVTMMDASFALPECRGNGPLPIMEVGLQGDERNRAAAAGLHRDSVQAHGFNHQLQGNYMGQPFQQSGAMWLGQQSVNNGADGGSLPWNGAPILPCFQGSNLPGGSLEVRNVGAQGYHEAPTNRGSANFLHAPAIVNQLPNLHPAPCIQGLIGSCVNYHPPVAATSSRHPTNSVMQHGTISNSADAIDSLPPPSGTRMYRSHMRGVLPAASSRHQNARHVQILPADEVAILEIPSFYEAGNFVDHHREMRLDIDGMSYEELLALSEQIGIVNTGLSEESISNHLKTRLYGSLSATINLEELPHIDQKNVSCIICQDEYDDNDRIAMLDCGHEYHADCLKKWLYLKNVCPICKSTALAVEHRDG
ncbi:hypothetical protein Nepgr_007445 [Nepenthes gracilis]|uniref:RING-type E3 ubiquitin transferase n=1 Tax=Nepenthes gracilis TaxID=150966 RepID=A0AAD3S6X7_NEPGR|nr:hypothetical protein Nepgr_007445 [Nepenthes gracilis]